MLLCYRAEESHDFDLRLLCDRIDDATAAVGRMNARGTSLTQRQAAVQRGREAAGVGVDGDVGGRGVQQGVPHHHREDDALAGDGVERCRGPVS